ncbi:NTP transferase domain-containing protein, partial [Schaalia cardiffensis]
MSASLTQTQFDVLRALMNADAPLTQRELKDITGSSLGRVNTAVRECEALGYIADRTITQAGLDALAPYKVDNAVILAAGMSSRFAPISYERPKGTLRVRGEILIERQIRQLQEVGITDITVVVGYKKEYFFNLVEKFGVTIVVNPEYMTRNNNGSLWLVLDRLANTYICSSDDYFTTNPFESHVYKAYYSAEYVE